MHFCMILELHRSGIKPESHKQKLIANTKIDFHRCHWEESAAHPPPTLSSGRLKCYDIMVRSTLLLDLLVGFLKENFSFNANGAKHSFVSFDLMVPSGKLFLSTQMYFSSKSMFFSDL